MGSKRHKITSRISKQALSELSPQEKTDRRKKQYRESYYRHRDEQHAKAKTLWKSLSSDEKQLRLDNTKRWKQANPEKAKAAQRRSFQKLRKEILEAYGAWCHCPGCTETYKEFLAIDHLSDAKPKRVGTRLYSWLRQNNFPAVVQILCHNCNQSKAWYGYCPHW